MRTIGVCFALYSKRNKEHEEYKLEREEEEGAEEELMVRCLRLWLREIQRQIG